MAIDMFIVFSKLMVGKFPRIDIVVQRSSKELKRKVSFLCLRSRYWNRSFFKENDIYCIYCIRSLEIYLQVFPFSQDILM